MLYYKVEKYKQSFKCKKEKKMIRYINILYSITLTSWYNSKRNQHTTMFVKLHKSTQRNDADNVAHDNSYKSNSKYTKLYKLPWKTHNYQSSSPPPCTFAIQSIAVKWRYFLKRWRRSRVSQEVWSWICVRWGGWRVRWWRRVGLRIWSEGRSLGLCHR